MDARMEALLRLSLTRGLGRVGLRRLMEAFGSPDEVLLARPRELVERAGLRAAAAGGLLPAGDARVGKLCQAMEAMGARLLSLWDEDYPPLLRQIPDAPPLLYLRGRLPDAPLVAIVGSRDASREGLGLAFDIARKLAEAGVGTVSGLARGVDGAAHEGTLAGGGQTVAVLGCGPDRVYPPEHARLFRDILSKGAVLAEVPPGSEPLASNFPGRNRIISGLAGAVLIVEAKEGSGSLITADFALEQGREVLAVPGAVRFSGSQGPNRLIREGATLVTCARDVLEALGMDGRVARPVCAPVSPPASRVPEGLCESARKLCELLGPDPLHMDEIARKTGLTPMDLSDSLLDLELAGAIVQLPGARYVLKK